MSNAGLTSEQYHPQEAHERAPEDLAIADAVAEETDPHADYGTVISIGESCVLIHDRCILRMSIRFGYNVWKFSYPRDELTF